jgi:hypothetical protein
LEGLEAAIATLQAENKDLRDRMIGQNTNSIMTGGHYALPLSPDPSSIAIPAKRDHDETPRQFSSNGDDSEDDDEDDGDSSMAFDRERSKSMMSTRRPSVQASPKSTQPAPVSAQHAQALVTLTTENASLKNRLAKLEKVVQVLLGMNGGIAPVATDPTANLDVLRLLGPDVPQAPINLDDNFGTLNPSTYLPPQVSPSDISPGLPASQASSISQALPTELLPTGPALTFPPTPTPASLPSFPITENQDHARHPAAMTTNLECQNTRGSALQRACFSSLMPMAKKEAREREITMKEMKLKVGNGLKKVLEWRTRCLMEEQQYQGWEGRTMSLEATTMISSAA